MIFVEVKENEGLDRALKRFKKKIERVHILRQARARMYYVKPTIRRKMQKLKAIYRQKQLLNQP